MGEGTGLSTKVSQQCDSQPHDDADGSYNIAPRQRAPVIHRDEESGEPIIETMSVHCDTICPKLTTPQAMGLDPPLDETPSNRSFEHHQRAIGIPPRP